MDQFISPVSIEMLYSVVEHAIYKLLLAKKIGFESGTYFNGNDHNKVREVMTAYLSEDDGFTWKYKNCINFSDHTTYPDAEVHNGTIYAIYDHDRTGAKEIILCKFTEEDIINNNPIKEQIISKAYGSK